MADSVPTAAESDAELDEIAQMAGAGSAVEVQAEFDKD